MKTRALLVMSAFLLAAAGPVFAWTNQDQLACGCWFGVGPDQMYDKKVKTCHFIPYFHP